MTDLDNLIGKIALWQRKHYPDTTIEQCADNLVRQAVKIHSKPIDNSAYADTLIALCGILAKIEISGSKLLNEVDYQMKKK